MTSVIRGKGKAVRLSVVVPCFNEEAVIDALIDRLKPICDANFHEEYQIILVNDGSRDRTWSLITKHADACPLIIGINLSRNYGHQIALTAGLHAATGDLIFILDADLQDPPELLPAMINKINEGYDVVYGQRAARAGETFFKRASSALFYQWLRKMSDVEVPVDTGDFRLMSRRVVDSLNAMPERYRFVRGMVSWIGHRQTSIYYERDPRHAGQSHYPIRKMLALAADAITSFSTLPLRFSSHLGMIFGVAGLLALSWVAWSFLIGEAVPGWASISALVLILGSTQLLMLGVIGEYLGRMYMESKRRPLYLIEEIYDHRSNENPVHALDNILRKKLYAGS